MMRVMHAQVMRNFILGSPLGIFCFNPVWGTGLSPHSAIPGPVRDQAIANYRSQLSPHSAIPGLSLFRRNRFLIRIGIKGGT